MMIPGILAQRRHSGGAPAMYPLLRTTPNTVTLGLGTSHPTNVGTRASVGDLVISFVMSSNAVALTQPSGWTVIGNSVAAGRSFMAAHRIWQAGDASSFTSSDNTRCTTISIIFQAGTFDSVSNPVVSSLAEVSGTSLSAASVSDPFGAAAKVAIQYAGWDGVSSVSSYPLADNQTTAVQSSSPQCGAALCTDEIDSTAIGAGSFIVANSTAGGYTLSVLVRGA